MIAPTRIHTLDGLRGVAVMGILLMNITAFALPLPAYINPLAYGGDRPLDIAVWAVNLVLVDGKMRGLFSLLFGAGMVLTIERSGDWLHFRRMGWLFVFGLAHAYLIWFGDILLLYAVVGVIAWFFVEQSVRSLVRWALACLLLQLLISAGLYAQIIWMAGSASALDGSPELVASWRELRNQCGRPDPEALATELALFRGGYAGILHYRLTDGVTTPFYQFILVGAETLGLMLLGMAALKSGFLTGEWPRLRYRRIALRLYAIALPPMAVLALLCIFAGFDDLTVLGVTSVAATPFRPLLVGAHAALIIFWLKGAPGALAGRIEAAGRAAFSNYLGASILMTTLFYGYGLGLFGRLDRAELMLVVIAAWGLMLLWSEPWLDRFAYGPFEWLWRSLARGARQPIRRQAPIAN